MFRKVFFVFAGLFSLLGSNTSQQSFAGTQIDENGNGNSSFSHDVQHGIPAPQVDLKHFSIDTDTPIAFLNSLEAFRNLTASQQLYAHHFSRASWIGSLIDLFQTSVESPFIFLLFQQLFRTDNLQIYATKKCNFSSADWDALQKYAAGFYNELGNYRNYGNKKFIPLLPQPKMECLIQVLTINSPESTKTDSTKTDSAMSLSTLWNYAGSLMYNLGGRYLQYGLKPIGITTYFSANCDETDAKLVQAYMDMRKIEGWNNRVIKTSGTNLSVNGKNLYEIQFASVMTSNETVDGLILGLVEEFQQNLFVLTRGGFSEILSRVNDELALAAPFADRTIEKEIILSYIESFTTGSVNAHKNASKLWVQDKMPTLESYIGFIETYQDPSGQRASFEGFLAVVDKAKTARLTNLVSHAENFLTLLPWPRQLEKDHFSKPDFTDLTVVSFGNGAVPAGINLPNYNEVRQSNGFKNVNLGNIIAATYASRTIQYLLPEEAMEVKKNVFMLFDIIVGLHELLGHGSGKLFMEAADGTKNFDANTIGNVADFGPVNSWYRPGQTYEGVFGKLASSFEECRAETSAVFLSMFPSVLSIWNVNETSAEYITYLLWLFEASQGIVALAEYKPATDTWGEAHAQGHAAILRVMLESGAANIKVITGQDGRPDLLVTIDRQKLMTAGKTAMGHFLLGLQYHRSTANITGATQFYDRYTSMKGSFSNPWMQWYSIALERLRPRPLMGQPNTVLDHRSGFPPQVVLNNYDASAEGIIQSFQDRFHDSKLEHDLFSIATRERNRYLV